MADLEKNLVGTVVLNLALFKFQKTGDFAEGYQLHVFRIIILVYSIKKYEFLPEQSIHPRTMPVRKS